MSDSFKQVFKELKKELETQDNRSTRDPIFEVRELVEFLTEEEYAEYYKYSYDDDHNLGNDKKCLLELAKDLSFEDYEGRSMKDLEVLDEGDLYEFLKEWTGNMLWKHYFLTTRKTVAFFLTEKEADKYIERHRHNLTDPITYVTALKYSYSENDNSLIVIRNLILEGELITKKEQDVKVQELKRKYEVLLQELRDDLEFKVKDGAISLEQAYMDFREVSLDLFDEVFGVEK